VSQTCHKFSTNGKQLTTPKDRAKKIQADYPRPMNKTRKKSFPASTCTSIQPGFTYPVDHGPVLPSILNPCCDPFGKISAALWWPMIADCFTRQGKILLCFDFCNPGIGVKYFSIGNR